MNTIYAESYYLNGIWSWAAPLEIIQMWTSRARRLGDFVPETKGHSHWIEECWACEATYDRRRGCSWPIFWCAWNLQNRGWAASYQLLVSGRLRRSWSTQRRNHHSSLFTQTQISQPFVSSQRKSRTESYHPKLWILHGVPKQVWDYFSLVTVHRPIWFFSDCCNSQLIDICCSWRFIAANRISGSNLKFKSFSIDSPWWTTLRSNVERSWRRRGRICSLSTRSRLCLWRGSFEEILEAQWLYTSHKGSSALHLRISTSLWRVTIYSVVCS